MDTNISLFSNQLADAVAAVAPSVVQVQGRRRPVSGLVYEPGIVVTTARALGRGEHVSVRSGSGDPIEAEFAGWDPSTHLVVLRVPGLEAPAVQVSKTPARVGHLALAVARSWSNAVTASAGIVSVIGGAANKSGVIALAGVALFLAGLIYGIWRGRLVSAKKIDKEFLWLSGCGPEFLSTFPEWTKTR